MNIKPAKIIRLTENGIGYFNYEDNPSVSAFSFNQIKGYKGESAKELGLYKGSKIKVECDTEQHISSVSITAD